MTEEATTTTTQDLKQKLADRIDTARGRLEALKQEVAGMHEEDKETLRERQEELQVRLDEQKATAQKVGADIQSWKEEKVTHTKEAIGTWREKRELKKLERRAERAEDYALDLVTVAVLDFEEAEQAVLDALAARFDAEAATAAAP